jgi:hypothetical protein
MDMNESFYKQAPVTEASLKARPHDCKLHLAAIHFVFLMGPKVPKLLIEFIELQVIFCPSILAVLRNKNAPWALM